MATIPTEDIVLAALVFTTVLVIMIYTLLRMRRQRDRLKRDIGSATDLLPDRAYNQVALATSEAIILERDGVDTHHPRDMLAEAQKQLDRHNFASALRTSQSAHDQLVLLRRSRESRVTSSAGSGPPPANRPLASLDPGRSMGTSPFATGASRDEPANGPTPRTTPNQAESHFQMNCLASELAERKTRKSDDPRIAQGERLLSEAQAAYRKQDYTEALRASLKGRRAIGTQLETLAPTTPGGAGAGDDPTALGTGTVPCPTCGRPNRPIDKFCRGCGGQLMVDTCPRCRQPLDAGDSFCGHCGAPIGG
ncbi:MAG: zinc ribbon domain-containing protein [Thermoplasmata archaeon]